MNFNKESAVSDSALIKNEITEFPPIEHNKPLVGGLKRKEIRNMDIIDPSSFLLNFLQSARIEFGFRKFREGAFSPERGTTLAAAYDIRAWIPKDPHFEPVFQKDSFKMYGDEPGGEIVVPPHKTIVIPTGLNVKIPVGFALEIQPRSGQSIRYYRVSNAPGLVDADYFGEPAKDYELFVIFFNASLRDNITIKHGNKIAQAKPVWVPEIKWIDLTGQEVERHKSNRIGGLGSTG